MRFTLIKKPCCRRLAPLTDRRERRTNVASPHHIVCALARGDLEFWSATEKLQMTAAWDSGTTAVSAEKVRWLVAIGVLRASPPEERLEAKK